MDDHRTDLELEDLRNDQNGRLPGAWLCCIPCYWLKRNDGVRKAMLTIATLLVTVVLVASPVIFLISSVPGNRSKDCEAQECVEIEKNECTNNECMAAASRIMAAISWSHDPCQDFYQYACGTMISRRPAEGQNIDNSFVGLQASITQNIQQLLAVAANTDPFQKLATFYKSCLRTGDVKTSYAPMVAFLNELGGYTPPTKSIAWDLTSLVVRLLRINGASLFQVRLDQDVVNSSMYAPYIDLPRDHLFEDWEAKYHSEIPSSEYFTTNPSDWEPKLTRELAFLKATVVEQKLLLMEKILLELLPENMTSEEKAKEVQGTLLFTSMLIKLYPQKRQRIGIAEAREMATTVVELETKFPFVQWKYLLEQIFNSEFSPFDTIYLLCPTYLQTLDKMLPHFQPRVIHNGLLVLYAADTLHELVNASSHRDWPTFCTKMTMSLFKEAVSALFVSQFEPHELNELRKRMTHMMDALRRTLGSRIKAVSWLDQSSRSAMLRKLSHLKVQFPSWQNMWNTSYVDDLLHDVHINPEDFFGNVLRRYGQLSAIPAGTRERPAQVVIPDHAFIANAFYLPAINTMMIPLAVLVQPNFNAHVPEYIPYATVGQIIAHEILHAFDLIGGKFNHLGEWEPLLMPESSVKFDTKLDCIKYQYSQTFQKSINFMGKTVHLKFDWNKTKNENMADISGIEVAYQTWTSESDSSKEAGLPKLHSTPQQLFFLNAAQMYCCNVTPEMYILLSQRDTHAPYPERVNGMMMNSPAFATAFQCRQGRPMNPKRKCTIW